MFQSTHLSIFSVYFSLQFFSTKPELLKCLLWGVFVFIHPTPPPKKKKKKEAKPLPALVPKPSSLSFIWLAFG
jgi:hypothetical protein